MLARAFWGHPSGPRRSSRPSAEWPVAGRSNRLQQQGFGLLVQSDRVRDRPSGALRCGDLPCQFRLTSQGCQSKLTGVDIEKLSVDVSSDDPAVGLRASLALHRLAERVEANNVAAAREKGWSWQQIGDALGVTRQSVHTKYNKEPS